MVADVVRSQHHQQQQQKSSSDADESLPDSNHASRLEQDADVARDAEQEQMLISLKERSVESVTSDESGREPVCSGSSVQLTETETDAVHSAEKKAKLDLTEKSNDSCLKEQSIGSITSDESREEALSQIAGTQLSKKDTGASPSVEENATSDSREKQNVIAVKEQSVGSVMSDESGIETLSQIAGTQLSKKDTGVSPSVEENTELDSTETRKVVAVKEQSVASVSVGESQILELSNTTCTQLAKTDTGISHGVEENVKLECSAEAAQSRYLRSVKKEKKRKKMQTRRLVEEICR